MHVGCVWSRASGGCRTALLALALVLVGVTIFTAVTVLHMFPGDWHVFDGEDGKPTVEVELELKNSTALARFTGQVRSLSSYHSLELNSLDCGVYSAERDPIAHFRVVPKGKGGFALDAGTTPLSWHSTYSSTFSGSVPRRVLPDKDIKSIFENVVQMRKLCEITWCRHGWWG